MGSSEQITYLERVGTSTGGDTTNSPVTRLAVMVPKTLQAFPLA